MEKVVTYVFFTDFSQVEKRTKQTWLNHQEKGAKRIDISLAEAPTVTFFTCVLCKATLEGTKWLHLCKTV